MAHKYGEKCRPRRIVKVDGSWMVIFSSDYIDYPDYGMFTPWNMKLFHGSVKIVIGCWTHPGTTSVYSKEWKNDRVIMEFQGPQNIYLKAYVIHWHGPTEFVMGEAKEVLW